MRSIEAAGSTVSSINFRLLGVSLESNPEYIFHSVLRLYEHQRRANKKQTVSRVSLLEENSLTRSNFSSSRNGVYRNDFLISCRSCTSAGKGDHIIIAEWNTGFTYVLSGSCLSSPNHNTNDYRDNDQNHSGDNYVDPPRKHVSISVVYYCRGTHVGRRRGGLKYSCGCRKNRWSKSRECR
jgi:hypothetical protein